MAAFYSLSSRFIVFHSVLCACERSMLTTLHRHFNNTSHSHIVVCGRDSDFIYGTLSEWRTRSSSIQIRQLFSHLALALCANCSLIFTIRTINTHHKSLDYHSLWYSQLTHSLSLSLSFSFSFSSVDVCASVFCVKYYTREQRKRTTTRETTRWRWWWTKSYTW